ncbi:MAG: hypothetical protein JEY94_01455 [Melioribacteraceae bacterium]|nr:hypothetical protein [Melioribacteraceae bacterium]
MSQSINQKIVIGNTLKYLSIITLVILYFSSAIFAQQIIGDGDCLSEGFKNPPTSAKPKGYWCLVNGNFDLTQMTKELREYKEKGVGTLDIWDVAGWVDENKVVPAGSPFMSDKSVQAITHAIREAGKIGMDIGITISSSWNAGGDWVKPEDGVMGLFESSVEITGSQKVNLNISFPEIPNEFQGKKMLLEKGEDGLPTFYKEVAVLAYQFEDDSVIVKSLNISGNFNGGKLLWDVPEGNWRITRYVCTGTGQPLMRPSPNSNGLMIDHFNAEATKRHINFFFEKLENELGDLSKTALKYLYTDSYEANSAVWTVKMPEEFKKRTGYELAQYLPALKGFVITNKEITERFLFDFKKVLSDLIIENHYELGQKLCLEKGIEFIAEAGGPGPPLHNCPFESLSSLGKLGAPRGEFWFDPMWAKEKIDELQIIKGPASAGHLYNHKRVEAESFTGTQIWQFGPGDLKSTADRAMCEGLTSFVYHTSPHIPREAGIPGWIYNFGTIINTTRAWWPLSEGFHNYIGRSCFLLQQGNFVGDVLYYYGDEAPNFVKPKHIDPSLGFGYDYDVTNSDIILNHLDVKDGYYILPHGQKYKILVLPNETAMNPIVLEKISQLVKKGGVVVGEKPSASHSLFESEKNNEIVTQLANKMWSGKSYKNEFGNGIVFNRTNSLREILLELGIKPDIQIANDNPEDIIDFIHRQTKSEDIYFIRNKTNIPQTYNLTLRTDIGAPALWNPDDASKTEVQVFIQEKGFTNLPLKLDAFGSTFIVFEKGKVTNHIVEVIKDNEKIFPSGTNKFPLTFLQSAGVFNEFGKYKTKFSNGKSKEFVVGENEVLSLSGQWELRFPFGWGTPTRTVMDSLISWIDSEDEGIKYFSGIAEYHKSFDFNKIESGENYFLNLGEVSKVSRVYLNGHDLGIKWFAPYKYKVTEFIKSGNNNLIIEVANVMSNQMTGDSKRVGRDKRTHSNITRGPNAWMTPYKDLELIKSGLLGPVRIISVKNGF